MGLKWSAENILGWRTRYDAVLRWRDRCVGCYSDGRAISDDALDFVLAFFIFCYSLRDFVIKTGGVKAKYIDDLIADSEPMRICRDVCNRSKHCNISSPSIDSSWSLGREYAPWPDGTSGFRHFLIAESRTAHPLEVVKQCVQFWDDLVAGKRFQEPTNPFAPPPGEPPPPWQTSRCLPC